MRKLNGSGLPDVMLVGGVVKGADGAIAYRDLDGLYRAIANAIATRPGVMTGPELRFLRKRLGMTQEDVAKLGNKTSQIAAKWEKGTASVPLAESAMLKLVWLERHARRDLAAAVRSFVADAPDVAAATYVMRYENEKGWREVVAPVRPAARRRSVEPAARATV